MRTRFVNAVLLVALAFAVSRIWLFLDQPPPGLPPIHDVTAQPPVATSETEGKASGADIRPETYDVIVARDLFSPTRGVIPPATVLASAPAPKPQPAPKLTLYGVVISDGEKAAFLQEGTQETRPRKVHENESFANGVVKAIRPDGVTFLFAGTEINVPLRTPKDGAVAPTPGRQEPGSPELRPHGPVIPRRQTPAFVPQGRIPVPSRPANVRPAAPAAVPPADHGGEIFEEEEFPEGAAPGEEQGFPEEEVGD